MYFLLQPEAAAALKFVVVMWDQPTAEETAALSAAGLPVHTFDAVLELGKRSMATRPFEMVPCAVSDLATLCYTSGTTGGHGSTSP